MSVEMTVQIYVESVEIIDVSPFFTPFFKIKSRQFSRHLILVFKGLYDSPVSILQLGKKIFPKSYLEMA